MSHARVLEGVKRFPNAVYNVAQIFPEPAGKNAFWRTPSNSLELPHTADFEGFFETVQHPFLQSEKMQGLAADPVYAKGEVFAYVGLPQNLKDLKDHRDDRVGPEGSSYGQRNRLSAHYLPACGRAAKKMRAETRGLKLSDFWGHDLCHLVKKNVKIVKPPQISTSHSPKNDFWVST